jgi:hypothetical protein
VFSVIMPGVTRWIERRAALYHWAQLLFARVGYVLGAKATPVVVSLCSLAVAATAITISWRSLNIAKAAADRQALEATIARQLVVRASFGHEEFGQRIDSMTVQPTSSDLVLPSLAIVGETDTNCHEENIHGSFKWLIDSCEYEVLSAAGQPTEKMRESNLVIYPDTVPLVIEAVYTYKGERLTDRSLYAVHLVGLWFGVNERPYGHPEFTALTFERHLSVSEDSQKVVDSVASQIHYGWHFMDLSDIKKSSPRP